MSETGSRTTSPPRRSVFRGLFVVLVMLTSLQIVFNLTGILRIPNANTWLNRLILYRKNISREIKEIHWKLNETLQFSNAMNTTLLRKCPGVSPHLLGPLSTYTESPTFSELEQLPVYSSLLPGGRHAPRECDSEHRVAIVIPYRNREEHLRIFLYNIHPVLQRQYIDYGIYVVEQIGKTTFNRALLMNIGYTEAVKIHDYNCFVFHDVDLLPEDDRIFYGCGEQPRHLSAAVDKFRYRLPYHRIFGGVAQISRAAFEKINGFSNKYFGWGGEDDDMYRRIEAGGFRIKRYSMRIARYRMISHKREQSNRRNPKRYQLLQNATERSQTDGINSLKYKVLKLDYRKLYTLIAVEIDKLDYS